MVLYRPEKEVKEKISKGIELPMEIENIRREINILFEPNVKTANPMKKLKLKSNSRSYFFFFATLRANRIRAFTPINTTAIR